MSATGSRLEVLGTVLLQGPIGILSDRFDRRLVLTLVTLLTAVSAVIWFGASFVGIMQTTSPPITLRPRAARSMPTASSMSKGLGS